MCPTPPTPITTAVEPGTARWASAPNRVVGGEAGVRVRRDGGRLDSGRERQQRALGDEHVLGESAVHGQARELVLHAVHVVPASARDAEAAAVGRIDEDGVALRNGRHAYAGLLDPARVLVPEDTRQRHAGRLHQPVDRVQVGRADPGAADPHEHVARLRDLGHRRAR